MGEFLTNKKACFQNPFLSAEALVRKFQKNGRSHSAPGSYGWQNNRYSITSLLFDILLLIIT